MPTEAKWHSRAQRYKRDAGGSGQRKTGYYIWRVPHVYATRTRKDHLRLDGQMFRWDDPPVVNPRTGERGHPGMDSQCRCYAEPADGPDNRSK